MRVVKAEASKQVIGLTPHLPASMFSQNSRGEVPRAVTTPIPVTTTLRSVQLLAIKKEGSEFHDRCPGKPPWQLFLLAVLDIFDDVPDALQFFRLFVRDFVAKLL